MDISLTLDYNGEAEKASKPQASAACRRHRRMALTGYLSKFSGSLGGEPYWVEERSQG